MFIDENVSKEAKDIARTNLPKETKWYSPVLENLSSQLGEGVAEPKLNGPASLPPRRSYPLKASGAGERPVPGNRPSVLCCCPQLRAIPLPVCPVECLRMFVGESLQQRLLRSGISCIWLRYVSFHTSHASELCKLMFRSQSHQLPTVSYHKGKESLKKYLIATKLLMASLSATKPFELPLVPWKFSLMSSTPFRHDFHPWDVKWAW